MRVDVPMAPPAPDFAIARQARAMGFIRLRNLFQGREPCTIHDG
jgi:hypothetical protein